MRVDNRDDFPSVLSPLLLPPRVFNVVVFPTETEVVVGCEFGVGSGVLLIDMLIAGVAEVGGQDVGGWDEGRLL